jgi:uncharacterized membrane protein
MTLSKQFFWLLNLSALLCLLGLSANNYAAESANEAPQVKVLISGQQVTVDVEMMLPVTPQQAWSVWTDYENLPSFIPSLKESHIVARQGNLYQLHQRGLSQHGPITFPFETQHEDEQTLPHEMIRSHQVKGSLKSLVATTQFLAEGDRTRIVYHAESVSGFWLPPIVTQLFIEHETGDHYRLMRDEVLRRLATNALPDQTKLSFNKHKPNKQLSELSTVE